MNASAGEQAAVAAGRGAPVDDPLPPAPLMRRMLCLVYESMLLFGVTFGTAFVYGVATNQRHAMQGRSGLIAALFLVLGAYFIGFWLHGGQTLAMKTWHIRIQRVDGTPLRPHQALARYLGGWAWVMPPLLILSLLGLTQQGVAYVATFGLWIIGYAALATRHPRGQFVHDALCGTEMVSTRPVSAGGSAAS